MTHDWLLVETLGTEPAVVARGSHTKNLVPISSFLRRNPNLMAIQTAINETVHSGKALSSLTPKSDRVIRTEVVRMSDGRMHGVHVWIGPLDAVPPERLIPGPLKWDLTNGIATDTPESLLNSGRNLAAESTHGRAFAEDLPTRDLNPSEADVLSVAIEPQEGRTFCTNWEVADHRGNPITVGFVARVVKEQDADGRDRLICRAMNWRSVNDESAQPPDDLGQRILNGLAQPGVHRALVDLKTWGLLKWLDDPCPFYDWRNREAGGSVVHPDDEVDMMSMATEFKSGSVARVLRLRAHGGGWTPIHVTAHRVEVAKNTYAGLLSLRVPTDAEQNADPGAEAPARKTTRRARTRVAKAMRP